jgi:hypothetical protein
MAAGIFSGLHAAKWYVAPGGSDGNGGSITAPFATWARGQTAASAGDTVFFRAGTYYYTKATTQCASQTDNVNANVLNKSGTSGNLIHYIAYPGETPVFDFYNDTCNCRIRGVYVTGSYLHLKGLELRGVPQNNNLNHENWCIYNTGSNNIFEQLNAHHNMGPSLFISNGNGNLVLNCDFHDNFDSLTSNGAGESADGYGCHTQTTGAVNTFRGCRAWNNADDGFDCINCDELVLIENCWHWHNGYIRGTSAAAGNGNGFKIGGFGNPPANYPSTIPRHTARHCVSFYNRAAGFYQNHHPASNYYYNNTSYSNGVNFNMLGYNLSTSDATAGMGVYRNNLAFTGTAVSNASGTLYDAAYNSWNLTSTVTVTTGDFRSIDTTGISGPRKADGSLPDVSFLHLATGSDCIDKGINVGLAYNGSAPDLGAYEYSPTAIMTFFEKQPMSVFRPENIPGQTELFDLSGRRIISLHAAEAGTMPAGIFIYRTLRSGSGFFTYPTIH